jgi:hypothetical protein
MFLLRAANITNKKVDLLASVNNPGEFNFKVEWLALVKLIWVEVIANKQDW